jgi:BASS family bile acid:Na+ symporter
MNIAGLLHLALPASLALIVLSMGLNCSFSQATFLLRSPALLMRSLLAMSVLLPLLAVLMVKMTHVSVPVSVALIAYAVSPVPPILPNKQLKLVSEDDYVYGLLVAISLLAIVLVPVSIWIIGTLFDRNIHVDATIVARSVVMSVLAPLAIGMFVGKMWSGAATRISGLVNLAGNLLLLVGAIPVLIKGWQSLDSLLGDGTLVVCIVLVTLGLVIGHLLGGPKQENRSVLALATASRHPGVAIAIGSAVYAGDRRVALAVLLALVVSMIVEIPYTLWRKRVHQREVAAAQG